MISQLLGALLLTIAVLGTGTALVAAPVRRVGLDPWTAAGMVPLLGTAAVGIATLLAGHVGLLHPAVPMSLAVAGVVAPVLLRSRVRHLADDLVAAAREAWLTFPTLSPVMLAALLLAVVAGLAPPSRTDEVEYHWPAPVAWAANGAWDDSPYRHVDAFPFMEVVYTSAALVDSPVAAHWIHTLTMVGMALCAAGLAVAMGSRLTVPVASAAVVSPVVWLQSFAAYNDVAAAAFSVGAVAAMVGGRYTRRALGLTCLLLSVAISIKPTSVAAVGVLALVALVSAWWRVQPHPPSVVAALRCWVPLALTGVLTLGFWTVRQRLYTGLWLDPAMTAEPDAYARTMLPDAGDRLVWPLVPLVSGVLGSAEPWGGRTSLVLQVLLVPALLVALWLGRSTTRRFAVLALPAYLHWLVLGVAIVRTRFHILSWVLLVVAVAVVADDLLRERPAWRRGLHLFWLLLILVGLADVLRQTVDTIARVR